MSIYSSTNFEVSLVVVRSLLFHSPFFDRRNGTKNQHYSLYLRFENQSKHTIPNCVLFQVIYFSLWFYCLLSVLDLFFYKTPFEPSSIFCHLIPSYSTPPLPKKQYLCAFAYLMFICIRTYILLFRSDDCIPFIYNFSNVPHCS